LPRTPGPPARSFIAALASIAFIGPLAVHLFMPVMPEVQKAFAISSAATGLMMSIALVVMAFSTLVYGSLSDRHGRRPVLLTGLVLFVAGSGWCAVAGSASELFAGRILQAAGAGAAASLNRAIAHDSFGPDRLVRVLAYLTMAYTIGPMLSPFIGGLLIDGIGWRAVFWFALLAGLGITVVAWRVLRETKQPRGPGVPPPRLLAAYRDALRRPVFCAFVLQSGFSTGTFMAMATATAFLMRDYLERPAAEFGLYFMMFPCGLFTGNFIASRLSGRVPVETMVLTGSALMSLAIAGQAVVILSGHVVPLALYVPGFLVTFSQGLAFPNAQTGAMRVVPHAAGTAAGLGVFFQSLLGAAGAQAFTLLADGTPTPLVITAVTGAICTLGAGIVPFALARRARQH